MKNIIVLIVCLSAFFLVGSTVVYDLVWHDSTMTGGGVEDSLLKVDTTVVSTRAYVDNVDNAKIFVNSSDATSHTVTMDGYSFSLIEGSNISLATLGTSDDGSITINAAGPPTPSTISPSQLTSDQDNYHPTGMGNATYVRISGDNGVRAITGIEDSTAGVLEKIIFNIGSYPIYFPMDHPDSDAAHRFTGNSGDFILHPGMCVKIWYDLTSTKWRIMGETDIESKKALVYRYFAGSVTQGDFGAIGFSAFNTGAGHAATASTSTVPAADGMSTGTTNAGVVYAYYHRNLPITWTGFGSAHLTADCIISIPTLSTGSERFTVEFRYTKTPASSGVTANNSFGIRYCDNVNSGKFQGFTKDNAGSENPVDLGVTVAANTLYRLRIELDKSRTEARFYIDDVFVGRSASNIPQADVAGSTLQILKSVGTTARTLYMHSFSSSAIYP